MRARVIADNVQDRRAGTAGVVKVGDAVRVARPEVQQRHRGLAGHPAVTVRGAGADALEQPQDRTHARHAIERDDERHFRRAGIRETDVDAALARRFEHDARAIAGSGIGVQVWDFHSAALGR